MSELKIQMIPTAVLEPYENNAKIHTREQIAQICESIKQFGFNDPIAVWGSEIVEGHGRLMAAKELGLDEVPVIRLDHLTDEQRRAYTHVHNQLTMNTGFEWAVLEEELANLNFDWEELGFDLSVFDDVLREDISEDFSFSYRVVVDCEDEAEQKHLYEMLTAEGYSCRLE